MPDWLGLNLINPAWIWVIAKYLNLLIVIETLCILKKINLNKSDWNNREWRLAAVMYRICNHCQNISFPNDMEPKSLLLAPFKFFKYICVWFIVTCSALVAIVCDSLVLSLTFYIEWPGVRSKFREPANGCHKSGSGRLHVSTGSRYEPHKHTHTRKTFLFINLFLNKMTPWH